MLRVSSSQVWELGHRRRSFGSGNVYVTGGVNGTVDFGGGPLTSFGSHDIVVVSFTSMGAHRWSKRFGSTEEDVAHEVAAGDSGNIALVARFQGSVDFGDAIHTSAGDRDVVLMSIPDP